MLTGKIYKNKLSTIQQFNLQQNRQLRSLNRVKSQPGFTLPTTYKSDHMQNLTQGTLKNQRQKILQQYNSTSQMKTFPKLLINQPEYQQSSLTASQHILEYQRKMKDHIQKIQARYQNKIAELEFSLQAKNQIISQLKDALEQKQKIIEKIQEQNKLSETSRPNTSRFK